MVPETYRRFAERGIGVAGEPDSRVFANSAAGAVARSYNLILDQARAHDDLEALVLLHQDAEIVNPRFCEQLRAVLADPAVAIVGCVGARGVRSLSWWEGAVTWSGFVHSSPDFEPGEMPELNWNGVELAPDAGPGEVDTLDGFVLALSPWAVRNLRFDEGLAVQQGYDLDICMQARAAGRKVIAEELGVLHHHELELVRRPEPWMEAHMALAEKWDPRASDGDDSDAAWKARARRAEAEAGAAQLAGVSKLFAAYARDEEQKRELAQLSDTLSWRLTAPLRDLNAKRRRIRSSAQVDRAADVVARQRGLTTKPAP